MTENHAGRRIPPPDSIVIVGAGQAGGWAARTLRREGFVGRLLLIGEETYPPYERPPLSKSLLRGATAPEAAYLLGDAECAELDIELRRGVRAEAIDPGTRRVLFARGGSVPFDQLLLATGSRARQLSLPGMHLENILYLRTIPDALRLRSLLATGGRLVIIGAGYVGLEVAATARALGAAVTVLEAQSSVMARALAPEAAAHVAALHKTNGVNIRLGQAVAGFAGPGKVERVLMADGTHIKADAVFVGTGAAPATKLAASAGLETENGIVVDEYGRTSAPGIFAAGDVTNHPNRILGRRVRLESWQNAQNQAIAVARNMLGAAAPYNELPWFWTEQYDMTLQMLGLPLVWDRLVCRGAPETGSFSLFYLAEDRIIGINAFNAPRDIAHGRRLIERRVRVSEAALTDTSCPLKRLVKP